MVVKLKEKCQNTKKQRGPGTLFSQWKIIKGLDTEYNEMDVVLCDALTTLHRTCKISHASITQMQRLYLCLCSVFVGNCSGKLFNAQTSRRLCQCDLYSCVSQRVESQELARSSSQEGSRACRRTLGPSCCETAFSKHCMKR